MLGEDRRRRRLVQMWSASTKEVAGVVCGCCEGRRSSQGSSEVSARVAGGLELADVAGTSGSWSRAEKRTMHSDRAITVHLSWWVGFGSD